MLTNSGKRPAISKRPKGEIYDVKSSSLIDDLYWQYNLGNTYREDIEWFYLLAYDKDFKILLHTWRVPGNFIDRDHLHISLHDVENMREYEITDNRYND